MKLFLDIDGVLLGRRQPDSPEVCLANHAIDFLQFATQRFSTWWLTTHCQGDAAPALEHLARHADERQRPRLLELASCIRPTNFSTWKTEALPVAEPFVWIDDAPLATELAFLRERGWLGRWLCVDTREEPDDLLRARQWLERFA